MSERVKKILVIRMLPLVAEAICAQNVTVVAFNLDKEVITLNPGDKAIDHNLQPRDFQDRNIFSGIKDWISLAKIINREKPDIVHVNALQDLIPAYLAVQLNFRPGKKPPIVAMSHNPLSWNSPARARTYSILLRLFASGFVALARSHKEQLIRLGIKPHRIAVIPNVYDPAQKDGFIQHDRHSDPTKYAKLLYVANICHRKAQDILVRAAAVVLKKHPELRFSLLGKVVPGEEEYRKGLETLVAELNISQFVFLRGGVPYSRVAEELNECDLFVFPTRAEMLPRAVVEAMLAGKPVIASGVDGILDLIQDRQTGLLVPPGDVEKLADAINYLVENPEFANTLATSGREFILDYCSPERVGNAFVGFYDSLLK